MIKILHLQPQLNLACGVTKTISQIIANSSNDFQHYVISLGGDGISRFESSYNKPIILNLSKNSIIDICKIVIYLNNFCKMNSIQIIHSHHRFFDSISAILSKIINIKTITTIHNMVYGSRIISYKSSNLISCSNAVKRHLMKEYKIDGKRIKVIYNSCDPQESIVLKEKLLIKKSLAISENDFVLGFLGRYEFYKKGIGILLEAFKDLSRSNNDLHLVLVGNGPDISQIERYIYENNIKVSLVYAKENVYDYYNILDLVILPSLHEAFSLVSLECGVMKKTFIGSNIDGISELIENEENGLLFKSGNVEELKAQIIRIYNDRKFGEKLAENLHKKVLDSFTVDKIIPQYEKLYSELLVE